jgi:hypothetical protein
LRGAGDDGIRRAPLSGEPLPIGGSFSLFILGADPFHFVGTEDQGRAIRARPVLGRLRPSVIRGTAMPGRYGVVCYPSARLPSRTGHLGTGLRTSYYVCGYPVSRQRCSDLEGNVGAITDVPAPIRGPRRRLVRRPCTWCSGRSSSGTTSRPRPSGRHPIPGGLPPRSECVAQLV